MKILTLRELQPPLNGCVVYKHYHSYLSSEWVCGFAIALNREGNLSNSISWTARDRTELEREREREVKRRGMEGGKGVVKHIVLAKFKEGTTEEEIEKHIKNYADLLNHIEHMKSFEWYLT